MFGFFGWSWFNSFNWVRSILDSVHIRSPERYRAPIRVMVRKSPYLRLFMASMYNSKYRIRRGPSPRR